MFNVWDWQQRKIFVVYDVVRELGKIFFLIYDNTWVYRSSNCFEEYAGQDV